jgi:hypothetical protein
VVGRHDKRAARLLYREVVRIEVDRGRERERRGRYINIELGIEKGRKERRI